MLLPTNIHCSSIISLFLETYQYTVKLLWLELEGTVNKGNNKITALRTILQKESQNSYVYKQTKSVNNRKTENRNDPDLV